MNLTTATATPPLCLGPDLTLRRPRQLLPTGSTDCHCHVYGDTNRYPLGTDRSYTPMPASLDQYLAMCESVGIERTVQVNASVYGTDNSVTLDIIAKLGQQRARGVAGIAIDTSPAELERLHAGGMRGVRLSTKLKGYGSIDALGVLAPRLAALGWHLQVHVARSSELVALEQALLELPVSIVFDHMGSVRGAESVGSPGFQVLLRLLTRRMIAGTKISSWYRRSDSGGPAHADMRELVQALVDARSDRLVFGTNWPHPNLFAPATVPSDSARVDQFFEWLPDATVRQRILVDNPARLYGF